MAKLCIDEKINQRNNDNSQGDGKNINSAVFLFKLLIKTGDSGFKVCNLPVLFSDGFKIMRGFGITDEAGIIDRDEGNIVAEGSGDIGKVLKRGVIRHAGHQARNGGFRNAGVITNPLVGAAGLRKENANLLYYV